MPVRSILEEIIDSIERIPPFPKVALRVLEIAEDASADVEEVVKVIQYDQAATTNCLKLCNSSYFSLPEKVRSIRHAVVFLGFDTLVRIVIADCSKSPFSGRQQRCNAKHLELWLHSAASATVSHVLAGRFEDADRYELFTAALLHDIGKLIIDRFIANNFEAMFHLMQDEGYGMVEAEKAYLGIDHAELGGLIAEAWKFPPSLINAIRNHHRIDPMDGGIGLNELTVLANLIAHIKWTTRSLFDHQHIDCSITEPVLTMFELTGDDVEQIGEKAYQEMKKTGALLKLPTDLKIKCA